MTLPNFLIIGAAKSGTSSLYRYLNQHPQIYMSPIKEPHFFSFTSETKRTSGPGDTVVNAITDLNEYVALFNAVNDEIAIGEASPTYLYVPEAAHRIHDLIPEVKLICILRNPIYRAYSSYMHLVRDGRETARDFKEALDLENNRMLNNWGPLWHYKNVGLYYNQLKRYYDLFNPDQLMILLQEELFANRNDVLIKLFNFLGVEPNFKPDSSIMHNMSGYPKNLTFHWMTTKLFDSPNPFRWLSRKMLSEKYRYKVTTIIRQKNLEKKELPENLKIDLIEYYREDILQVQELINRDLSHWLK